MTTNKKSSNSFDLSLSENINSLNLKIGFYFITDSTLTKLTHVEQVEILISNELNLKFIQYREKQKSKDQMINDIKLINELLSTVSNYKRPRLIVNDYLDIALEHASGVHLGSDDEPLESAISKIQNHGKSINKDFVIGVSATSFSGLLELQENYLEFISYVGFGPIYKTLTKKDAASPVGIHSLKESMKLSKIPIVAIGGINKSNLSEVLACYPNGIAAISMVLSHSAIDVEIIKRIQKFYSLI
ncbi:MAG: thiamine phosphate synthase [Candidatus Micrarchaeota archaeon]|nr:thiamine phosphate synthase [Candidatus Micrarchaeota archaeon]